MRGEGKGIEVYQLGSISDYLLPALYMHICLNVVIPLLHNICIMSYSQMVRIGLGHRRRSGQP